MAGSSFVNLVLGGAVDSQVSGSDSVGVSGSWRCSTGVTLESISWVISTLLLLGRLTIIVVVASALVAKDSFESVGRKTSKVS